MKRTFNLIAIIFSVLAVILFVSGPKPKSFEITKTSLVVNENFKGFSEEGFNAEIDVKALKKKYDLTRQSALTKTNHFIRRRNVLSMIFHGLCIVSIIASFILSYLGSSKGLVLTSDSLSQSLESLKQDEAGFKKRIIILSSLIILFTTLSNRVSVYADQAQNKAGEIIEIIKTADFKVNSSISAKDAQTVINSFELDISKY